MESQLRLMWLVDQFFDASLRKISGMLDSKEVEGNHKLSVSILEGLQFNFNVVMHFFRVCYSSLKPEHK
jgi:hypothetical protein